jgi:hypothetical protein
MRPMFMLEESDHGLVQIRGDSDGEGAMANLFLSFLLYFLSPARCSMSRVVKDDGSWICSVKISRRMTQQTFDHAKLGI